MHAAPDDFASLRRVLEKLRHSGLHTFHLTGSFALRIHRLSRDAADPFRECRDIDLVVPDFAAVPDRLTRSFLLRHVHPGAHAGQIAVQLVDPGESLRIDLFTAVGATMDRARRIETSFGPLPVISIEDLAARIARIARILLDLGQGDAVPRKYAADFRTLAAHIEPARAQTAWHDHRKPHQPASFAQARRRLFELLRSREDLLIVPSYSRDIDAVCPRCREAGDWRLTPAAEILAILGHV